MGSGFYAAFSGWLARSEALDTAASNLANSGTQGFRAERDYFRSALMGPGAGNDQLESAVDNIGVLGGDQLDLTEGTLTATGNPLDVAIEGRGFFAIQTPNGVRYTRSGNFRRSSNGTLETSDGDPVLSARPSPVLDRLGQPVVDAQGNPVMRATGKPMVLPPGEVSIGSGGVISVNGATVGTIGVFDFPKAGDLQPEGANNFVPVGNARPKLNPAATLEQGTLEGSNQNVIQGTMDLIMAQRQAEMMEKALVVFNNDMNKTAAEDLPKV